MKYSSKGFLVLGLTLILSHFFAYPVGEWYELTGSGQGIYYIGPFPGYLSGLLFSYAFLSTFLFTFLFRSIKYGALLGAPAIFFIIMSPSDPWVPIVALLFLFGLGLAWIILQIKNKVKQI